ncbi:MAG TPA: hypothetical protein VL068_03905 [Microthrixaceae bacterium]|nr:hypothetical protein [Microthrixaceae bacterium]
MDLLDEESHRLLLWAVRLFEVGITPTSVELARLAEPRHPVAAEITTALIGRTVDFSESSIDSLLRRGLVDDFGDDSIGPTDLGRAVVNALGIHPEDVPLFEILDADLRSSDPLIFARVVSRISSLNRPMIVDPYCRRAELEYLTHHTDVTRVLVSDRLADNEMEEIVDFVSSIVGRRNKLRVRVAPAIAIHDRHVIDGERVLQVAGLVQSDGVGATVITEPVDLGTAVQAYYKRVWKDSAKLVDYRPGTPSLRKSA